MHAYDWLEGIRRLKSHLTRSLARPDATAQAAVADAGIRLQPMPAAVDAELPQVFYFRRKPAPALDSAANNG
jgi:hypothetical protein